MSSIASFGIAAHWQYKTKEENTMRGSATATIPFEDCAQETSFRQSVVGPWNADPAHG